MGSIPGQVRVKDPPPQRDPSLVRVKDPQPLWDSSLVRVQDPRPLWDPSMVRVKDLPPLWDLAMTVGRKWLIFHTEDGEGREVGAGVERGRGGSLSLPRVGGQNCPLNNIKWS